MLKKIVRREAKAPKLQIAGLHPLLQRIFASRGVHDAKELEHSLQQLTSYKSLLNSEAAARFLADALQNNKKILVVGDFDCDGATSSAVAVSALRAMGAKNTDFLVPNRFTFGYGLTPEIVDVAAEQHPDIIITVDNGISSHAGVARANELGIQVLVTDHHLAPDTLPDAAIIVNPNQPGDDFPSKCSAGVGVIFYVMCALRAELQQRNWFVQQGITCPSMAEFLDLVALGTVADVVPLDHNNRILVQQGVARIKAGRCRPGITALLQVSRREPAHLVANDLGFSVGPRLNAAGRLDDMSIGVRCLLSNNMSEAQELAEELQALNQERREIEQGMQEEALKVVKSINVDGKPPAAVCLYDPSWHQGVIGLVASRIKEKIHRPVIAFAQATDTTIKGSARSIPGVHIRDVLADIATQRPDILSQFGGHAMAAGLSLLEKDLPEFKQLFAQRVAQVVSAEDLQPKLYTDGDLSAQDLNLEFANLVRDIVPWGSNFVPPSFDGTFEVVDWHVLKDQHLKLWLRHPDSDEVINAIQFNAAIAAWNKQPPRKVNIAYRLDVNHYRGNEELQLMVEQLS